MKTSTTRVSSEIIIDKKDVLVTRTDHSGIINYANDTFIRVTGFSEEEIIGKPHNIIRHPDMPKAIFYMMWKHIKRRKNIIAIVKNCAKNGDYYWVATDFRHEEDYSGAIKNYVAFRRPITKENIEIIEKLYEKLLEIENTSGMDASVKYFNRYLKDRDTDYPSFISDILVEPPLTQLIMKKIKNLFS
jgi:PAS domain S-box-containing protein